MELFDFELKPNDEPIDSTRINLVNLYFSVDEKLRFNALLKKGMLKFYGSKAKEANAIDFLLELLEINFGEQPKLFDESDNT